MKDFSIINKAPTHTPLIGILADDLTSAADGGAPFQRCGHTVTVLRGDITAPSDASTVWSADCASRSLSEIDAATVTDKAARSLAGASLLFKTIDSTLRGHIKAEISAAFTASKRKRLIVTPAFPAAGRITRDGVQYVHDIPVCQSSYANDPVHPARSSRIRDSLPADIADITILNAETQEELTRKVAAIKEPENALWVGSPGLAMALADRFKQSPVTKASLPPSRSILTVVGSANPISRQQAKRTAQHESVTCLMTPEQRSDNPDQALQELVTKAMQQQANFDTLIATGGDTMQAMLDRLKIKQFTLQGELEPGFVLAKAKRADGTPLILGMKAGGFGDEESFLRAAQILCSKQDVRQKQ
ncbi:four-carbon acid sugar kinase family protein [Cohaesibacter gelatinilyticus]|uniref:Uncharacterized conserved protein YgbK, DUF1537 family n=1 Tax=Cohaesibacter gelatinilyticus TaxID=372072 RepID=A0A285PEJ6_9HYPH|nr:four-carbon acid sugar kinase family protein [Cohaesibacter gelatinilyticus]SNZ19627.1 Uncharacterized conserved protein YgbK, DUF1537 family [Cohaesibacter gelatinilyticus]